ncbi:glycosyl hydrolase family 28-related protein [Arthrobacter sp. NPDC093128]|uniref:right-handed parallel beta-helix repeat-containing protein n=1 Tax=Arthrobacter sp. NPDC093128 TaxID=3154979 RepID=UPI00341675E1
MVIEIGNIDQPVPPTDTGVRRRGLLSFGTLMAAFTGASAVAALGASSAQAAPGDKYVPIAEKGAPSGVAALDSGAKIPPSQLPDLSATFSRLILAPVNVKDAPFNAAGDGITNDTAAIQAALNTGRNVYIPGGRYSITSSLVMATKGQRLSGAGCGNFLDLADTSDSARTTLRLLAGANCDIIRVAPKTPGIDIRDLQLYGNRLFQSGDSTGIHVMDTPDDGTGVKSEQPKLTDIVIRDMYTDGVRIGFNAVSSFLNNVAVYNSGRDGIRMDYTDSRITNCEVGHCIGDGIAVRQWTTKIIGCDIWGNKTGVSFYSGGRNGQVIGCCINGNKQNGVAMLDSGNLLVGCELHDNSNGAASTYHNVFIGAGPASVQACNFGAQGGLTTASNIYIAAGVSADIGGHAFQSGSAASNYSGPGKGQIGNTPRVVHIPATTTPLTQVGFGSLSAASADFFAARNANGGTLNDYIEWDAHLDAGTYSLDVYTRDGTTCGLLSISLDGAALASFGASGSSVDTYAAAAASTKRTITGIVIPSRRTVRVRVTVSGKNPASSSYFANLNALTFSRTA